MCVLGILMLDMMCSLEVFVVFGLLVFGFMEEFVFVEELVVF